MLGQETSYPSPHCLQPTAEFDGDQYTVYAKDDYSHPWCMAVIWSHPTDVETSTYAFDVQVRSLTNDIQSAAEVGIAFNVHTFNTFDFVYINIE